MPRTNKQVEQVLKDNGFSFVRVGKRSENVYSDGTRTVIVPTAKNKQIPDGTLGSIARQAGLPPDVIKGSPPKKKQDLPDTTPPVAGTQGSGGSSASQQPNQGGKKSSTIEPKTPTIISDPIPKSGDTTFITTKVPKSPTIVADPIPGKSGGLVITTPGPKSPTILADPTPDKNPTILNNSNGDGSDRFLASANPISSGDSPGPAPELSSSAADNQSDASSSGPLPVNPPPAYTGGAPVESVSQNDQTGVTQTVTDTGAVIDQNAGGTPYRAGWVDPNNPDNSQVLAGATNPYTQAPDPWQANAADISNSISNSPVPDPALAPSTDNMVSDAASGGGYSAPAPTPSATTMVSDAASGGGYSAPQPNPASSPLSTTNMVSDAASGGGYSSNDTDTTPLTLGFSGPDVVPQDPSTGFAYGDADPYASPAPGASGVAAAPSDNNDPIAPPPPPVAAPDNGGDSGSDIALPDPGSDSAPMTGVTGLAVDPNTGGTYGDWQP